MKPKIIYLLGTSYSGSTYLSMLLGSSERVFSGGELNQLQRLNENKETCTCGEKVKNCTFWKKVRKIEGVNFERPSKIQMINIIIRILLGQSFKQISRKVNPKNSDEYIEAITTNARKIKPKILYICDASKSIWRLLALQNCYDIKVVHVKRNKNDTLNSFYKYKKNKLLSKITYYTNSYLLHTILKSVEHLTIDNRDLRKKPEKCILQLETYLGISIPQSVNLDKQHIATGNQKTRKKTK